MINWEEVLNSSEKKSREANEENRGKAERLYVEGWEIIVTLKVILKLLSVSKLNLHTHNKFELNLLWQAQSRSIIKKTVQI